MVRLTLIARKSDGLPLAEGLDNDKDHDLEPFKQQAKVCLCAPPDLVNMLPVARSFASGSPYPPLQQLLKRIASAPAPASRASLESGAFTFHYSIDGGVCYLTLAEKSYPRRLAHQYLEELQSEFSRLYGPEVEKVQRPYAFIKFGERQLCTSR